MAEYQEIHVKLPKQWKHWCRKMGLRPPHFHQRWKVDRNPRAWMYLHGKGHVWRVNCYGEFERGDKYEEFDRWALCNIDSVPSVRKTFAEFKCDVESLIAAYDPKRPLGGY